MILKPIRGNAVHLRHNIYILINYHEKQIGNIAFIFGYMRTYGGISSS